MIDNFAIALTHAVMLYVAWRMTSMPQVDDETAPAPGPIKTTKRWGQ